MRAHSRTFNAPSCPVSSCAQLPCHPARSRRVHNKPHSYPASSCGRRSRIAGSTHPTQIIILDSVPRGSAPLQDLRQPRPSQQAVFALGPPRSATPLRSAQNDVWPPYPASSCGRRSRIAGSTHVTWIIILGLATLYKDRRITWRHATTPTSPLRQGIPDEDHPQRCTVH